ncbi:MAG: Pycsar system effector family protein [Fidelibacterota bacterium]
MIDRDFTALFHVLSSEQQILQRTDQKAFTMLSILGVFMVFFMVHFTKMEINWFIFFMVIIYFVSALMTIIQLILVIVPRIRKDKVSTKKRPDNPTFFAGIAKFSTPESYAAHLKKVSGEPGKVYEMFATQVFSLGKINLYKNVALKRSILFFVAAIMSELIIIMSLAWTSSMKWLQQATDTAPF